MKKAFIGSGMLALACLVSGPAFAVVIEGVPHSPVPVVAGVVQCPSDPSGNTYPPGTPYGAPVEYSGRNISAAGSLPVFSLVGPNEATTGPVFDTPIQFWPADGAYDFCAAFDTAACSLGALSGFSTDIATYAALVACSTDINGPAVVEPDPDNPGHTRPAAPYVSPNGIPDGEFELGLLAAVLNNAYALDAAKVGHTNAEIITTYKANFFFFKKLVAEALSKVPLQKPPKPPTDLRGQVPGLIPWVPSALVTLLTAFATEGDDNSVAALDTVLGLLSQLGMQPQTLITTGFKAILSAEGDADGDGFTNRDEYNYFKNQGAAKVIEAQLTASITPPPVVPIVVVEGGGGAPLMVDQQITLTAEAVFTSALKYEWFKNGAPLGVTAQSLIIPQAALTDSGAYTCVITVDGAGKTLTSAPAIVTVVPQGQLPIAGGLGLALLAGACALGGVGSIRRRK